MSNLPSIEHVLPHKAPMILIDSLEAVGKEEVQCQVEIRTNNMFFDSESNSVPAYLGIEFMAQAIAAWSGYHAYIQGKKPPIGFLLGSRRYDSTISDFPLGAVLEIDAQQIMEDNGMAVFSGQIKLDGEKVAQCQLNVFVPNEDKLAAMKLN